MRLRRLLRLLPAAALALAGCGTAADNSFRESVRDDAVRTCERDARTELERQGAWQPGFAAEIHSLCACTIERTMAGNSTTELATGDIEADRDRAYAACEADYDAGRLGPDGRLRPAAGERQQADLNSVTGK